jgi:hypothetical protein
LDDSHFVVSRQCLGGQVSIAVHTSCGDVLVQLDDGCNIVTQTIYAPVLAVSHAKEGCLSSSVPIASILINECGMQCSDGVMFHRVTSMYLFDWIWACHGRGAVVLSEDHLRF